MKSNILKYVGEINDDRNFNCQTTLKDKFYNFLFSPFVWGIFILFFVVVFVLFFVLLVCFLLW